VPSAQHGHGITSSIGWIHGPARVSLIRKRAQVLGDVEATSREAAEAAAVRQFNLDKDQRKRLVVQERG
jgi:hypothetical protein